MYYTYMLRCDDGSIYTGITTDLERRFKQHKGEIGGGAKYTKSRIPVKYEIAWQSNDRQAASKLEYRLKKISKSDKEVLISAPDLLKKMLSDKIDTNLYKLVKML